MATVPKALARKISDEVVTSDWANEFVTSLQSTALNAMSEAGFLRFPVNSTIVEVGDNVVFLRAGGRILDPVSGDGFLVSVVLAAPFDASNIGQVTCYLRVGYQATATIPTAIVKDFLVMQLCVASAHNDTLGASPDVVKAAVEHVREAFSLVDAARIREAALLFAAQLSAALAP